MPHEMKLNEDDGIVEVTYDGHINLRDRKKGLEMLCALYAHMQPLRILLDVRAIKMDLTFDEQKTWGEYFAAHPKLVYARAAVLHEKDHNPNKYIDTFAFNKGYLLAQFSDEEEARGWLKKGR